MNTNFQVENIWPFRSHKMILGNFLILLSLVKNLIDKGIFWNLPDNEEVMRAASSLCPVVYQLQNTCVTFLASRYVWLLQCNFIPVWEQVLCYTSSVSVTVPLLLKAQVECVFRCNVVCLLASFNGRF